MIWVTNKADLDFYTVPAEYAYCDTMGHPTDVLLQGFWAQNTSPYTLQAEVWTVDGNDILEIIDPDYYEYYIAVDPITGMHFFTWKLLQYSPEMCANKCFLIRIGVQNATSQYVFAAWTQRYAIKSCCDVPRGITVTEGGTLTYDTDLPDVPADEVATTRCGQPLIRIIGRSECYNYFNGHYYGTPANIITGSYIPYADIIVLQGDIRPRPRNIQVLRSFNCKIQRVESVKPYRIASQDEMIPAWRMEEIEAVLQSKQIWVDDYKTYKEYTFPGGTAFSKKGERICTDIFRLDTTLNECPIRQTFGCVTDCAEQSQQQFFVVPDNYTNQYFFDQNGNVIAQDLFELYQWMESQGLNPEVMGSVPCNVTQIIGVTASIIPPVIYWRSQSGMNAINPLAVDFSSICDFIPNALCDTPVFGTITDEDLPCDVPVFGVITDEDITGIPFFPNPTGDWAVQVPDSAGTAYPTNVEMRIHMQNAIGYVGTPPTIQPIASVMIATLPAQAIPTTGVLITTGTDNIGNIQPGWQLQINNLGQVFFTGNAEFTGTDTVDIDLTVTYNL